MKKIFSALAICVCAGTLMAFSACQTTLKDPASLYESFLAQQSYKENFTEEETLDGSEKRVYRNVTTQDELLAAIEEKQNVKLLNDITLAPLEGNENKASIITLTHEHNIYIHLNGFNLTTEKLPDRSGRYYSILNNGMLTLTGEGTILSRGIKNNGVLHLYNGVTVQTDDSRSAAIVNQGAFYMKGGALKVTHKGTETDEIAPLCLDNQGDAHLQGGVIESANKSAYAVVSTNNLTINTATVTGAKGAIYIKSGNTSIWDGSFTATQDYALKIDAGIVLLNGGSFTGNQTDILLSSKRATLAINGGNFTNGAICNCGLVTVNNGATILPEEIVNETADGETEAGLVIDNRTPEQSSNTSEE